MTWGEAAGQEAMMDMPAVRTKDRLASEKASHYGESGIEERDCQRNERSGHAKQGGGFLTPDDAEASEEETDRQATAIAHKDGCWMEVIGKKPKEGTEERGGNDCQGIVTTDDGAQEGGGGGEKSNSYGEAIEAVDQVKGI